MQTRFVRLSLFFILFSSICSVAEAECRFITNDTIKKRRLDSIKIVSQKSSGFSSNSRFSVGTNFIKFDDGALASVRANSLSDFIQKENASYIKEFGRGMNAYISIRGSSSSHTTVDWNGMNLAMPTLGQTDFSHIPLYLFDVVELHIGGNSAIYGEGAIGGTVQLKTSPKWAKGAHGDILVSQGSFNSLFTGGTLRYSNSSFETRTSLLYSFAENNYEFINNTKLGKPKERLNNSSSKNAGLLQEIFRKFKDSSMLSATLLYLDFDRDIQPSVSLNDRPDTYRSIYDNNLKMSLGYSGAKGIVTYAAHLSYSFDKQLYEDDKIAANRFSFSTDIESKFGDIVVKGGFFAEHTIPQVDSYADSVKENRFNLYLLGSYNFNNRLILSGGVRFACATDVSVPLMPSFDVRYNVLNNNSHSLAIRCALSGNSKIPTLNDRYWGGEHLYLKSESSITLEGGFNYNWFSSVWSLDMFGTLYKSKVNDWIRWLPAGTVWRPQNIPLVVTRGGESGLKIGRSFSTFKTFLNFSLAYTNIKMVEGLWDEDPAIGEQLAYQPKLSWRSGLRVVKDNWEIYSNVSYTGKRTTVDLYDILPSYTLLDIGTSCNLRFLGCNFVLNGIIKNITNEMYQNVKFYAMPGRNYQLSLQYKF
jgi:vitamin B12 transporter